MKNRPTPLSDLVLNHAENFSILQRPQVKDWLLVSGGFSIYSATVIYIYYVPEYAYVPSVT